MFTAQLAGTSIQMTELQNRKITYSRQELELCGTGDLFGPETAKLPNANMLMIDRILDINSDGGLHGKGSITAELDINTELWFSIAILLKTR